MDTIDLPVRYDGLSEPALQAHLRHCAAQLRNNDRIEILLCDAGVMVPVIKRVFRSKPATLIFLARSGSVGRDHLSSLRGRLEADGFDLTVSFTQQRKLLRRVAVSVPVNDPLFPLKGIGVLRAIASQLDSPWPQPVAVGYAGRSDGPGLPGQLAIGDPVLNASRKLGRVLGRILRPLIT